MQNAYDNVGKPWSKEETSQLIQSYKHTNKDVFELAAQHGRLPGGIFFKLKQHNLVSCQEDVRGYSQEKLQNYMAQFRQQKGYNNQNYNNNNNNNYKNNNRRTGDYTDMIVENIYHGQQQLKLELCILKNEVKRLTKLIEAIYEFENDIKA